MNEKQSDDFEERAAIIEFLANKPRGVAEAEARKQLRLDPPSVAGRDADEYADFD